MPATVTGPVRSDGQAEALLLAIIEDMVMFAAFFTVAIWFRKRPKNPPPRDGGRCHGIARRGRLEDGVYSFRGHAFRNLGDASPDRDGSGVQERAEGSSSLSGRPWRFRRPRLQYLGCCADRSLEQFRAVGVPDVDVGAA